MFNPRYARLFDEVKIGPKTAPNRFFQTPHASGMGWRAPKASAALRGIKAEGGWGVVSTEYCSIHPSSDDFPFGYLSLWDEDDVRALAKIAMPSINMAASPRSNSGMVAFTPITG